MSCCDAHALGLICSLTGPASLARVHRLRFKFWPFGWICVFSVIVASLYYNCSVSCVTYSTCYNYAFYFIICVVDLLLYILVDNIAVDYLLFNCSLKPRNIHGLTKQC